MSSNPTHCGQPMTKNGRTASGRQRYRCKVCKLRTTASEFTNASAAPDKSEPGRIETALAKSEGAKRKAAEMLNMSIYDLNTKIEQYKIPVDIYKPVKKSKVYIVTTAQNATPLFEPFFKSLLHCRDFYDAELIAIPTRYKNPTSTFTDRDQDWWISDIVPHLNASRTVINDNLVIMGDIKTQPTAVNPLSGFESISRDKSAIFGHTKIALSTVPVVTGSYPKIIATTGAVTQPNYTDSKAGKKGEFHHSYGALIVEVKGNAFHMRQLNACDDGSFIDLIYEFTPDGTYYADDAAGLVLGDWHGVHVSRNVVRATFTNDNSIVNVLRPKKLVWHDALDFYSRNHWHRGNPFTNLAKHRARSDDVRAEVEQTFREIEQLAGDRVSIFPWSNHPEAFARWIRETDWRLDPLNAEIYLETALAMVKSTRMNGARPEHVDPFAYWGKRLLKHPERFRFLGPRDNYSIMDIAIDMHGHLGANGARGGSLAAFSKLGVKSIKGHDHKGGIFHGAYGVGTSGVYDPDYALGPSSWLHTHCVIYANGKRSLINIIGHDWSDIARGA